MEIDIATAAAAFGTELFNLIRRGADGSLVLSADRWRLTAVTAEGLFFGAEAPEAGQLALDIADVERVVWDRLPRQRRRSQLRFWLSSGDLWTFSGSVDESALPPAAS